MTLQILAAKEEKETTKARGRAEQRIAEFNAKQKEREARSAQEAATAEEEQISLQEKKFKARQRVRGAKGGISISESSTIEVLAETAGQFSRERALTLRAGLVRSNFLRSQASLLRAKGKLSKDFARVEARSTFNRRLLTLATSTPT